MKIIGLRAARPGGKAVAYVDIEAAPGIRIYGLRVSRSDDGGYRVFGSENAHGRTCAFDLAVAHHIAKLTLEGLSKHEHRIAS